MTSDIQPEDRRCHNPEEYNSNGGETLRGRGRQNGRMHVVKQLLLRSNCSLGACKCNPHLGQLNYRPHAPP
jgi:hypothetical protein